jgi:hypothetical protein
MDKSTAAFIVIMACLAAVVALIITGHIPADVGVPILTLAAGAAVGYLFPSPLGS